ncbi:LacI family DNA-binding transcriptional regulator [Corynebacterium sp. CNCTC7651]|uniref:LacI family DNA-binding transcriptional regulator n=1 Tax=Corynebacterium sp. CNCTC7651 TaxID=2815361 RepID=UPI001F468732|nr:LacI family DNA-binding transcriptional regulator [Corynebacterium sp. CNCTC7651]UIZ91859.1 LacI family DNA-binding transcriptional regulator [Corynebacterium sp. CNCTC7651]
MPSLASIAAELGVSRTTVSNAYNHSDQLSVELRERILAAAERAGYAGPDPMARSLRTQRTGAIGVVLTEALAFAFEDRASVDFLAGLSTIPDYSLTIIPDGASVHDAIVDGIVAYSVAATDPQLLDARARGLPLVVCDQPKDFGAPFVGIDDRSAIKPAAQLLIDAGHTHIAILAKRMFSQPFNGFVGVDGGVGAGGGRGATARISTADLDVQRERVEGALEVFAAAGLTDIPVVTRHLNDVDAAADGARELLERYPDTTAILCTTDSMALGVVQACGDRVVGVGAAHGAISLVGFDGIDEALHRGITTVAQPNRRKGEAAAGLLRAMMEGEAPETDRIILDTELVLGRTVAPPA